MRVLVFIVCYLLQLKKFACHDDDILEDVGDKPHPDYKLEPEYMDTSDCNTGTINEYF